MKYLSEIIEEKQTALFKKYDVFFAFSDDQLEEGLKKTGRKKEEMTSLGMGMICPKEHAETFMDEHAKVVKDGIAEDIAQLGIEAVVRRELSNHECYYTGDPTECFDALEMYPVTHAEIVNIFNNKNYVCEQQSTESIPTSKN